MAHRSSWELPLPFQRIVSSTTSSLGPIGSGLLQAPSLQIGVRPMARIGLQEQGKRQRDLQQPSSPHGAAGRHSLRRRRRRAFQRPASPGSRCLAVPLSCCREVPAWVLPLSSPGTAPTSGSPCLSCNTDKSPRRGGDSQGSGMLKARSPRCRAQPARRLRVAQILRGTRTTRFQLAAEPEPGDLHPRTLWPRGAKYRVSREPRRPASERAAYTVLMALIERGEG